MRFFVAAVVIAGLIVAGHRIGTQFASSRSADAGMTSGFSVYQVHLNRPNLKTLPEQEAPLP
jgi:hypothetical protein